MDELWTQWLIVGKSRIVVRPFGIGGSLHNELVAITTGAFDGRPKSEMVGSYGNWFHKVFKPASVLDTLETTMSEPRIVYNLVCGDDAAILIIKDNANSVSPFTEQ